MQKHWNMKAGWPQKKLEGVLAKVGIFLAYAPNVVYIHAFGKAPPLQYANCKRTELCFPAWFGLFFVFGVFFLKCVLPEGLAKEPTEMSRIPQCLDSFDRTMILTINFHMQIRCQKETTDKFQHIPDLFLLINIGRK